MSAVTEELHGLGMTETAGSFDMPHESWCRLFRELADGRAQALEALYTAASGKLYGLALWRTGSPEDAADVVQQVFLRLAEQRDRLARVKSPRAWLMTVTQRAAIDVIRRRARRPEHPLEQCLLLAAPDGQSERTLDAERASRLLRQLPPAQRDVIYLRHFADCTFSEIGAIVGVPTFTAASRYRLGISKLRRLFEDRKSVV